jgi:N-carbamoylputrescine amidase
MNKASHDQFTLGLIQMRCDPDPAQNMERAAGLIRQAAADGAEIICLPELFLTPYFCQKMDPALFDLAESIPGPSSDILGKLAKSLGRVIVASLFERRGAGVYHNTAIVLDADGQLLGKYRKMHIPDDPLYFEKFYFTPGDLGFRVFETRFGRVGVLVCWDQWFPEAARLTTLHGADVLVYPTAIGWHPRERAEHGVAQHQAWEISQRGHAVANGVYVAAINRIGHEGPADAGLDFWGASFVSDPQGGLLAKAGHEGETVLLARCDLKKLEDVRRNWPFLRDRRIDAYGEMCQRWLGEG